MLWYSSQNTKIKKNENNRKASSIFTLDTSLKCGTEGKVVAYCKVSLLSWTCLRLPQKPKNAFSKPFCHEI